MAAIRRRVRGWLIFTVCGLVVLWFGDYLDRLSPGMGGSIIAVGFIWTVISIALLLVNLVALRIEKKKGE